jgi:hypothetical protein
VLKIVQKNLNQVPIKDKGVIPSIDEDDGENPHPLEVKYGKEPKINPEDLLHCH